jgi:glycosyltransferase involved in cell wall biosynthesis
MIEAMANGTPVVAFKRGSVPEILNHGVTGIVVDNLEEALAMLPQALALDRQRIRRRFEERFSVERMASDYVALYDEVLRRGTVNARVVTRTADQPSRDAA